MYPQESRVSKSPAIGCESQRESDIPAAVRELEKEISMLQDEMSILYGRLHPVMRNEPNKESECPKEMLDRCELSGLIRGHAVRVASVTKDVRTVLGLLEI